MQIKLETITATFGKSTFLDHVVVKSTDGNTIILELTKKQLTDKRKVLEQGCHVYYQDEEYTILCFGNVLAKPADIVLELDRGFPTETFNIYFLTKRYIKNVQGDLHISTLRFFLPKENAGMLISSGVSSKEMMVDITKSTHTHLKRKNRITSLLK